VPRLLEQSPWPQRRAEGLACAQRHGLRVLRDATPDQVGDDARGRHVVSEMARVVAFAAALRHGDAVTAGSLMTEGHASLRDDMEVSIPELDVIVEELLTAGSFGARLTGGGFGGCAVALAPEQQAPEIVERVIAAYRTRTGHRGAAAIVHAATGVRILDRESSFQPEMQAER
jgi:galactokinase